MRGMRTPDDREQSRSFARETQRVRAAIEGEDYASRMEQVISRQVSKLRRTFETILHPMFQLMRFYLKEPHQYRQILHTFLPDVYPGVLGGFSTLFDRAMSGLQEKSELVKGTKRNIVISEAAATLDRLGIYLFSGSAKIVGNSVFQHLGTTDPLRYGGWPYVDPILLHVQDDTAALHRAKWRGAKTISRPS